MADEFTTEGQRLAEEYAEFDVFIPLLFPLRTSASSAVNQFPFVQTTVLVVRNTRVIVTLLAQTKNAPYAIPTMVLIPTINATNAAVFLNPSTE